MADEIRFYRASEKPYGAFSNLYRREIEFEGERFATSEHAYQAGKPRKKALNNKGTTRTEAELFGNALAK